MRRVHSGSHVVPLFLYRCPIMCGSTSQLYRGFRDKLSHYAGVVVRCKLEDNIGDSCNEIFYDKSQHGFFLR